MMQFVCPCCGKVVQMPADWAGQQARCPHSQQVIQTPALSETPAAPLVATDGVLDVLPLEPQLPQPNPAQVPEGDADSVADDLAYMAKTVAESEAKMGWQAVMEKTRREQQQARRLFRTLLMASVGVIVGSSIGASLGTDLGAFPRALLGALGGVLVGGTGLGVGAALVVAYYASGRTATVGLTSFAKPKVAPPLLPFSLGCAAGGIIVGGSVGASAGAANWVFTPDFNRLLVQGYLGTALGLVPVGFWWARSRRGGT